MTPHSDWSDLERRRRQVLVQLASLGDLRPSTPTPRCRRCGKPSCHRADEGDPGHGPSWSLTWTVDGKSRTRVIPEEEVEETRVRVAECRRARELARELIAVCARMCDEWPEDPGDAEKKTSPRRSSGRSTAKRRLKRRG